ncbi:hypothetical protein [Microvirga terricola]|uniref:Uncharacterized protein n=1 Tax=Microvirga terricola TaxID=2719797 RepID=A0ABX0VCD8_9HYPH|nr:hypothetical protein [Microvirga terricola]NIX76746.1 hypothetical protein [Microvirga terricola]
MTRSRSRLLYIAAVLVSGIAVGFLVRLNPDWRQASLPPVIWPLAISLVVDLFVGQLAARGRAEPLTMNDRLVAVIGAGLIVTLMTTL